ncbi:MAG: hypothetical protein ACOYKJ_02730 [Candidatus Howiella sp.]
MKQKAKYIAPECRKNPAPNYVCTWNIQDWVAWHENQSKSAAEQITKRDTLSDEYLFGQSGWARLLYPDVRGSLIFLLDDGWELPPSAVRGNPSFGSQILHPEKFPDYGAEPKERLKTLNQKITGLGWRGTGLWICAQESFSASDGKTGAAYWRERLEWSKYAGIAYWKIDWGAEAKNIPWRRQISTLAAEIYPELVIEHIVGCSGLNDPDGTSRISGSLLQDCVEVAAFSDVFRTYDVLDSLSTAITFDRLGELLSSGHTEGENVLGLINAEDEVYMSAVLGATMGIMRFPPEITQNTTGSTGFFKAGTEPGHYFSGGFRFARTKATRRRLDEVARAVRWQILAPPFKVRKNETELSETWLSDDWTFLEGESWEAGHDAQSIIQKAPASIARRIASPIVHVPGGREKPFVAACRNPGGAISIGTFGRTHDASGYRIIEDADILLDVGCPTESIGVFGYYGSLTLQFDRPVSRAKIRARDLLSDRFLDISDRVQISDNQLTFSGTLLKEIGLSAASEGDMSEPGLILQMERMD